MIDEDEMHIMLRARLEQVSNNKTSEENIRQVALLSQTCPHTIVPLTSEHPLGNYTCLMHALGFTGKRSYLDIAKTPPGKVFAGAKFAEWLLCSRALEEVPFANAAIGDLVWYFTSDGSFKHVGLLRSAGRVESKWGDLGLFEHPLLEVPESYGVTVRVFKPLPYDVAIDIFYKFAKKNGINLEDSSP